MSMTVNDVQDLTRLLSLHPEWLAEVRKLVLTEDLLALPNTLAQIAAAQKRTDEQLAALAAGQVLLTERVEMLTVRLDQLTERVDMLTVRLDQLTERIDRLTERMDHLAAKMEELVVRMTALAEAHDRMTNEFRSMKGEMLEIMYRLKAPSYFGSVVKKAEVISPNDILDTLESRLTEEELRDVLKLDLMVRGKPRRNPELGSVILAIEVSSIVDRGDVERAPRRAGLLRKAGHRAVPAVGGHAVTTGASEALQEANVALFLDGRTDGWEEALQATQ